MVASDKSKLMRQLRIRSAIDAESMSAIVKKAIDFYLKHPDKVEEIQEEERAVKLSLLLGRLFSKDVKVLLDTIQALECLGDENAVPALCHLLKTDECPEVRCSAAEALAILFG